MNLFDSYKIKNHIRLIELFAGVGSQAMALRDIGADFTHWRLVEFCKYAVASYNAIHGTNFEPTDIRNVKGEDLGIVDTQNFTYLLTYSFPCQDLSLAGKQRGMTKGSGTRSGLLWEVERLLNETENLPQVLLMENVPQVHGTKNIDDFNLWIDFLKSKGYSNFWQDLNAKDYGVAQNRKRCFMVSILGNEFYEFPQPVKLNKCIKDYLEDEVDETYYIKSEKAYKLILDLQERGILEEKKINKIEQISNEGSQRGTVVSDDGLFPTISTGTHGYANPHIPTKSTKPECICSTLTTVQKDNCLENKEIIIYDDYNSYIPKNQDCIGTITTNIGSQAMRNGIKIIESQTEETKQGYIECKAGGDVSPTFISSNLGVCKVERHYRIRKLTPKECWRLMGFSDEDFEKVAKVNSNPQLYKQAGNSIVKDVLMAIFRQMID